MKNLFLMGRETPIRVTESEVETLKNALSEETPFEIKRLGMIINPRSFSRIEPAESKYYYKNVEGDGKFIECGQLDIDHPVLSQKLFVRFPGEKVDREFMVGDENVYEENDVFEELYYGDNAKLKIEDRPDNMLIADGEHVNV